MSYTDIQIGFEFEFCSKLHTSDLPIKLQEDLGLKFIGRKSKQWRMAWDSSIRSGGSGYSCHELVGPPMLYNNAIATLDTIFNWMKQNKCKTNSSTGLHINISFISAEQNRKIDPVKLIFFAPSDKILLQYKRQRNPYCKNYDADLKRWSKSLKNDHIQNWQHVSKRFAQRLKTNVDSKYRSHSYHFAKRNIYIEFRMIGNKNYHKRADEIKMNIDEMIDSLYISADEHACRSEYQQAISRFCKRNKH